MLLQLLHLAGFGMVSASNVARRLQQLWQQQQQLQLPMRQALAVVVAASVGLDSQQEDSCCREYLTACRLLADLFAPDVMSVVAEHLGAEEKQQQQLVDRHGRIWAPNSSSSSSSSSFAGTTAQHSSLQQQQHDRVHLPPGAAAAAAAAAAVHCSTEPDPATITQLLDAAEAASGTGCAVLLLHSTALINIATLHAVSMAALQRHAQQLLLLLGNPATPDSLWLELYQQHREAEAAAIADAIAGVKAVIADVARLLNQVFQVVGEAAQKVEAERVLCGKLYERLAAADEDTDVSPQQLQQQQQQTQQGVQTQHSSSAAASSSSSSSARFAATAATAAATAAAAPLAVPERAQLLDRLLLHAATMLLMPGADVCSSHIQALTKVSEAVSAAVSEANNMAGMRLPPVPCSSSNGDRSSGSSSGRSSSNRGRSSNSSSSNSSSSSRRAAGSSSSSLRLLRLQVVEVLYGFSTLISTTASLLASLVDKEGPFRTMLLYGNATGLGLLACLGLWQPWQDTKGLLSLSSSTSDKINDMLRSSLLRCCGGEAVGASEDDDSGDNSFVRESAGVSCMLLLYAAAIEQQDTLNMVTLLKKVCQQPGQGNSAADVARWTRNGFARGSLEQLQQQHCKKCSSTATAAASVVETAATVAAQQGPASTAAAAAGFEGEGTAAVAQHRSAVWRLLVAVKPSVAAALHCNSIPPACRSYEAFERAVLGWPPLPDGTGQATQQDRGGLTQQHEDSASSSSCSCGKPGYAFTSPRPNQMVLSDNNTNASAELSNQHRDSPGSQQHAEYGDISTPAVAPSEGRPNQSSNTQRVVCGLAYTLPAPGPVSTPAVDTTEGKPNQSSNTHKVVCGHAYTLPTSGPFIPPATPSTQGRPNQSSNHNTRRAVCGDAACVARELQQLAQQGPPAGGLDGGGCQLALQHVVEDLVVLPAEYR
jgi:hypothetical protein